VGPVYSGWVTLPTEYTTDAALLIVVPDVVPRADAACGTSTAIAAMISSAVINLWILTCFITVSFFYAFSLIVVVRSFYW
jgi:hypothetical protein